MSLPRRHWLIGSAAIAASLPALSWGASPIRLLCLYTHLTLPTILRV